MLLSTDMMATSISLSANAYVHGVMDGEAVVQARIEADPNYDGKDTSWLHLGYIVFMRNHFRSKHKNFVLYEKGMELLVSGIKYFPDPHTFH